MESTQGVSFRGRERTNKREAGDWQAEKKVETPPRADSSKRQWGTCHQHKLPQRFCAESLAGRLLKLINMVSSFLEEVSTLGAILPCELGLPVGSADTESACSAGDTRELGSIPGIGKTHWGSEWLPTPVFLPGESHGQRSLVGYSPQGCKESDTTEQLSTSTMGTVCVLQLSPVT